jgi:hypothetical protein
VDENPRTDENPWTDGEPVENLWTKRTCENLWENLWTDGKFTLAISVAHRFRFV